MEFLEKIRLKMQRKTNLRNTVRLIVSFASGIIAGVARNWYVFFILISAYCLFEMVLLFNIYRSRYLYENRFLGQDDDFMLHGKNLIGESINYAFALSAKKSVRSFILLSILGAITKILVGFFFFL